jgi:glucose/arabinose dehydrogenase
MLAFWGRHARLQGRRHIMVIKRLRAGLILLVLLGCGSPSVAPTIVGVGPDPALPAPQTRLVPTLNIAPATGWPEGAAPTPAPGLGVKAFATGLDHPRWLAVLPNGDVLVAESNKQKLPVQGLRGWIERQVMRRAGAEVQSADRITLLRDADGDGVAEVQSVFLQGLTSPFGMALVGDALYVANTDALMRFPYRPGETQITAPGTKIVDLPATATNRHWTKGLIAGPDGQLYVSVGSNSDHGDNGMEVEVNRAAIWVVNPATGAAGIYASGLRNPVGMGLEPVTGALWTVVNERDELGNDLVPDYLTSVQKGGFYGWPYVYYGDRPDPRVPQAAPELVARALPPDFALGSHVAPLGLAFAKGAQLGPRYVEGAFVGEHGSWNRRPASGYAVVFVPFEAGKPKGTPVEVLGGFRTPEGEARGRPAGVAIADDGALLVADDVGNTVWRVARP